MVGQITTIYETRRILDEFEIRAKKKYGQNFLTDRSVVDDIVEAAAITREDCVLEIGPGIGSMTQILSASAGSVVAVEIDKNLEKVLNTTLEDCENVRVLYQDILKTDLQTLMEESNCGKPMKCVANLPYYITTPILLQLLEDAACFESITIMIQKEVADRILAGQDDKAYGSLSLAVQYYARPELVRIVPSSCFFPRPEVDSAVLKLQIYRDPPVEADPEFMFALIRASFNQRRKTLANAVSHGFNLNGRTLSREEVQNALISMGLSENVRGEKLSLSEFALLARSLQ